MDAQGAKKNLKIKGLSVRSVNCDLSNTGDTSRSQVANNGWQGRLRSHAINKKKQKKTEIGRNDIISLDKEKCRDDSLLGDDDHVRQATSTSRLGLEEEKKRRRNERRNVPEIVPAGIPNLTAQNQIQKLSQMAVKQGPVDRVQTREDSLLGDDDHVRQDTSTSRLGLKEENRRRNERRNVPEIVPTGIPNLTAQNQIQKLSQMAVKQGPADRVQTRDQSSGVYKDTNIHHEIDDIVNEVFDVPVIEPESVSRSSNSSSSSQNSVAIRSNLAKKQFFENKPDFAKKWITRAYLNIESIPMRPSLFPESKLVKQATKSNQNINLIIEQLNKLLATRPSTKDSEKVENPIGLKIKLTSYQQYALSWLLWREAQEPSCGILIDEMDCGNLIVIIVLIMTKLTKKNLNKDYYFKTNNDGHDAECRISGPKGGTLILCPTTIRIMQWKTKILDICEPDLLSIVHFQDANIQKDLKFERYNIIFATHNMLLKELKKEYDQTKILKVYWDTVVLDGAHKIKNKKIQLYEVVCKLLASTRWALTETPMQSDVNDLLYSILQFFKCSMFEDLRVWKRWVDKKNEDSSRLVLLMETLMLKNTINRDLKTKSKILFDKIIEEVKLDNEEQKIYNQILIDSKSVVAQFLSQCASKQHKFDLYDDKATQSTKAQNKSQHADIKKQNILNLLLRLRQMCIYPALVHKKLDKKDINENDITENIDIDVIGNVCISKDPVFDNDRISSKMKKIFDMVKNILQKGDNKLVIISQWIRLLEVIASYLSSKDAAFCKIIGSVKSSDRQAVLDSFNSQNSGPRILLLSLKTDNRGLKLIGANHLLVCESHWDPHFEKQIQDMIYCLDKKKKVYIYKFICVGTIEERIEALQQRKLEITDMLSAKDNADPELTPNDLESLFDF